MNFKLTYIPERTVKPRNSGLTMMMDKGLSIKEVENFIEASSPLTSGTVTLLLCLETNKNSLSTV